MKINLFCKYILCSLFLFILVPSFPTKSAVFNQDDSTAVQIERVRELITYLEFALNTIGDAYTPPREKDIIITTSYSKFFRDEDVQVEDDLDLNRSTVTNKDVQAYLKDVEFFFKNVSFKLEVEDIQPMINDNDQLFYLVKLNRNLNGISVLNDTINQTITRYIEVNYDQPTDDLKIVSFYTTKLSEKEDLMNWWADLSFEWKYIFQQRFDYYDSVGYEQLKALILLDSLDLSSNRYIVDFEPLFKLDRLIYLNLSNTAIQDLSPLRIHNKIKHLDISDTNIDSLDYLKYAADMVHLNISGTGIKDLSILEFYSRLEHLKMEGCSIDSISFPEEFKKLTRLEIQYFKTDSYDWLANMPRVKYLDASYSNLEDLNILSSHEDLSTLILEGTRIADLQPLRDLPALELLNLESSSITSLSGLSGTTALKKIYCDNSRITNEDANDFMNLNPNTLVIFESDKLQNWWNGLEAALQNKFIDDFRLNRLPGVDELARMIQNDSLDLSGLKTTNSLPDLWPFRNLVYLDIHDTYISDINLVTRLPKLERLDAAFSNISGTDSLGKLRNLTYLNLSNTRVSSIESLTDLRGLTYLNIDDAQVDKQDILKFIESNPACLVIYRSVYLINWWEGLSDDWKKILLKNAGLSQNQIGERTLHIISYLENLKIDSVDIKNFDPLEEFYYLHKLEINRVNITNVAPLANHPGLTSLTFTASPIADFTPISTLQKLTYLDISNTGTSDLEFTSSLTSLETLKVSGTRIRDLNSLKDLTNLRELDISNTGIKSLKPIDGRSTLELVVCYNSNLKEKVIDKFRDDNPGCQVLFY